MSRKEFYNLPLCDFIVKLDALQRKKIEGWQHTRSILGVLAGKDPRWIIPLPGDFDHLKITSKQERIEKAERMGMKLSDEFKQKMLNG